MSKQIDREYKVCVFRREGTDPRKWPLLREYQFLRMSDAERCCDDWEQSYPNARFHFHIHFYRLDDACAIASCGKLEDNA